MKFARRVFLIAGIYGLIVLLPMYFLEEKTGRDFPPSINHPEYFYGFIGVAVAWQVLFLILSRDPKRYRPMMIPAILEKASFGIAAIILFLQHRIATFTLGAALVDLVLGVLFVVAYLKTASESAWIITSNDRYQSPQCSDPCGESVPLRVQALTTASSLLLQ